MILIRILFFTLMLSSSLIAMKRSITDIGVDPGKAPYQFFTTIESHIMNQVKRARDACQKHNTSAFRKHLKTIAELLTIAENHQFHLIDGYPVRGPLAQDEKRKEQFASDAQQSLTYTSGFKRKTMQLSRLFGPDKPNLSEEEWKLIGDLFNTIIPLSETKKRKTDSKE